MVAKHHEALEYTCGHIVQCRCLAPPVARVMVPIACPKCLRKQQGEHVPAEYGASVEREKVEPALRAALAVVQSTYHPGGFRTHPLQQTIDALEAELRKLEMLEE